MSKCCGVMVADETQIAQTICDHQQLRAPMTKSARVVVIDRHRPQSRSEQFPIRRQQQHRAGGDHHHRQRPGQLQRHHRDNGQTAQPRLEPRNQDQCRHGIPFPRASRLRNCSEEAGQPDLRHDRERCQRRFAALDFRRRRQAARHRDPAPHRSRNCVEREALARRQEQRPQQHRRQHRIAVVAHAGKEHEAQKLEQPRPVAVEKQQVNYEPRVKGRRIRLAPNPIDDQQRRQ